MKIKTKYVLLNAEKIKENQIITTDKNGKIISIVDGEEDSSFLDGIVVPGFFNCHTHSEFAEHKPLNVSGLTEFIKMIKTQKIETTQNSIKKLDKNFQKQGVKFVVDICNTDKTIQMKQSSNIIYYNCIEIYAKKRVKTNDILKRAKKIFLQFKKNNLEVFFVPHSCYTMNKVIVNFFKEHPDNSFASIHLYETKKEKSIQLFQKEIYGKRFINGNVFETLKALFDTNISILFVHGIHLDFNEAQALHTYFPNSALCVCPTSNLYLEKKLADKEVISVFGNRVFIGTDSNLTNPEMSIIKEMYLFQHYYKKSFIDVINSVTYHPAIFFGLEKKGYGVIKNGYNPGLNLLKNVDMKNLRITKETIIQKII